ncbi:MAG: hypothetical protein IJT54_04810 [Candidatus Methanomethylophilaceae archaeon]|nr:hypothetical protein [Candidatus Methanomethylophilaceae archaeon]
MMDKSEEIIFSMITDHAKYDEAVKYMSEMFEREVFDRAIILYPSGIVFSTAGMAALKRDSLILKDGNLRGKNVPSPKDMKGKKFVIIGDILSSGSVACELIKTIKDNGGSVVKLGFMIEDSQFNARKKSLKGNPVESMIIL